MAVMLLALFGLLSVALPVMTTASPQRGDVLSPSSVMSAVSLCPPQPNEFSLLPQTEIL